VEANNTIQAAEILRRSALRWPDHAAVIDTIGSYSYQQIDRASDQIAALLKGTTVPKGSIVGIALSAARDFLAALFGILKAGCIAIPIAPNLSGSEQRRVIFESRVSWLLSAQGSLGDANLARINSKLTPKESALIYDRTVLVLERQSSSTNFSILDYFTDAAVIRHTSGTTAKSKGVVLTHNAVCQRAEASRILLGLNHDDTVLMPLQLSYHFVASALGCIEAGATILDCAQLIAPEIIEFGASNRASMIYAAPVQYELMTRCEGNAEHRPLPDLRRAISTSALLPKRVAEAFFNRFALRLTQVYGIIEVGLPLWNELESIDPTALGICKAPYQALVVDDLGRPVPTGSIGELAIRGPGLFAGYLLGDTCGSPRIAERCLLAGEWFLTGDLVVQDQLGVILYRGRKKSVLNCGGNKVFPEEIEELLKLAPEIRDVRVIAEPDALLGSAIIAEIVLDAQGSQSLNSRDLIKRWRNTCFNELSEYKVPKEFRIVESLPTTGSGKIVRH
jgi:long-chain acyl-CoA synthetase